MGGIKTENRAFEEHCVSWLLLVPHFFAKRPTLVPAFVDALNDFQPCKLNSFSGYNFFFISVLNHTILIMTKNFWSFPIPQLLGRAHLRGYSQV
jgi:hypothetical protein